MCYLFNLISRNQEHFLVDFKNLKMILRHEGRSQYYNYVGGSYLNAESFFVNCIFLYFYVFSAGSREKCDIKNFLGSTYERDSQS